MADKLKLAAALLVIAAAIGGFYYWADHSLLLRVLGLLAAIGIALGIALKTAPGQRGWAFVQEAQLEVRKVVWPTRKETMQTTAAVMAVVVVVALFLWAVDAILLAIVQRVITG